MKHRIGPKLAAMALGLGLAGGVALADDNDNDRDHRRHDHGQQQEQNNQNQNDQGNRHWRGSHNQGQGDQQGPQGNTLQPAPDRNDGDRRGPFGGWRNNDNHVQYQDNRATVRHVEWNRFRQNLHSPQRFRYGVYHAPRGYYYRRWHYGERLPVAFYTRDYWLTDFFLIGLFAPPTPDLIWVRYGPDALLIDRYTGEIVQVRYDVFYS